MKRDKKNTIRKLGLFLANIALLAMVAMAQACSRLFPGVIAQEKEAKILSTRITISGISTSISCYKIKTDRIPASLEELTMETETSAPIMKRENLTDTWGTPFQYKTLTESSYESRSAGPDCKFGTDDDITN